VFEFVRYLTRNPSEITRGVRRLSRVRRAMREFAALPENRQCAWCGRAGKLDVHHIVPVSVAPGRADDPWNMIMLCRKPACHQIIGHNGDFSRRFVLNVREICDVRNRRVVRITAGKN